MRLRPHPILFAAASFGALAGCSDYHRAERPPWRAQAEEVCLAKGLVTETASVRPFHEMDGPGICGAVHPFKVTALDGGSVALNTTQTLDCPMIAALDAWVREVVQPAAQARFGERVVRIESMGSYNCRGINNKSGAGLSEHSFANAIDIGGFTLASGRTLNIMRGFNGADEQERAFLHEAHAGACGHFTTVLGPGYNIFHYNHFHLDLALHGATSRGPRRYCKPVPETSLPEPPRQDTMPDPPPIEEEMDIARAPLPGPSLGTGPAVLVASAPLPEATPPRATWARSTWAKATEAKATEASATEASATEARATQPGAPWPPPAVPERAARAFAARAPSPAQGPIALADDIPAVPTRRSAAMPGAAEEPVDPPLISFGGPSGDTGEEVRRPSRAAAISRPADTARTPRPPSGFAPEDDAGPELRPAPRATGTPRDWDITSSVPR